MITPKNKKCIICGRDDRPWFSKKRCKECTGKAYAQAAMENAKVKAGEKPNRGIVIKKIIPKQKVKIEENNQYYKRCIAENIIKNKDCARCDNCGEKIRKPTGRNVGHIISSGANSRLYHEPLNHFMLGKGELFGECGCLHEFDEGTDRQSMNIYEESERRRTYLKGLDSAKEAEIERREDQ